MSIPDPKSIFEQDFEDGLLDDLFDDDDFDPDFDYMEDDEMTEDIFIDEDPSWIA